MARLSDQPTPPGVLAVVRTPDLTGTPPPDGSLLVLDGVSDPGNVGTLVRTATALGVGVVSVGGADPFGPKAVRASAGTCYRARLSRADALVDIADALRAGGRPLLGLAAEGERTLREVADSIEGTGFVLVVGAEPHGIGAGAPQRARWTRAHPDAWCRGIAQRRRSGRHRAAHPERRMTGV
jgi:RNA methyltransferase, TrmH family